MDNGSTIVKHLAKYQLKQELLAHICRRGVIPDTSFCFFVKFSYFAHQVTVASYSSFKAAGTYHNYFKQLPASNHLGQPWCQTKREQHPQFYYWSTVMELELLAFQFIRTLHEDNLHVYSLNQLAPWFFALDHIQLLCMLAFSAQMRHECPYGSITHPSVYSKCQNGNFVASQFK